jgi:hypothetical protein
MPPVSEPEAAVGDGDALAAALGVGVVEAVWSPPHPARARVNPITAIDLFIS